VERQWQNRILIVDSDDRALGVIKSFLVNDGFDVTVACGLEVALNALQSCEYDLVLMDSRFADLTSSCFLERLLRIPQQAPVIVMESSPSRPCGLTPFNPLRASRFVNKWRPCEILEAVREVQSAPPVSEADQSGDLAEKPGRGVVG
jgi:CheY-like chemotaxis protein